MSAFGEFAHDQYRDVIALLAALSTRVKDAAVEYQQTDETAAHDISRFLTESTFRPADQRTK